MLKLHLETDIGGDIDDPCALAMVLNWPDARLLAITTIAAASGTRSLVRANCHEHAGRASPGVRGTL